MDKKWVRARASSWTTPPVKKMDGQDCQTGKIQRLRAANLCEAPYGGHHIYL
jgi:hypothetical protein